MEQRKAFSPMFQENVSVIGSFPDSDGKLILKAVLESEKNPEKYILFRESELDFQSDN